MKENAEEQKIYQDLRLCKWEVEKKGTSWEATAMSVSVC